MAPWRVGCIAALLVFASSASAAPDFPVPNPYPLSWELKFTHSIPKRITVAAPGQEPKGYWYMTYTITNEGEKEQSFFPQFDLLTDDGKVARSDHGVPLRVFEQIKAQTNKKLLEPFTTVTGPIRLGPAEARDSVAIWPETVRRMEHFSVFAAGLSGEAVTMKMVDGKLTPLSVDKITGQHYYTASKMVDGKPTPTRTVVDTRDGKDLTILFKTLRLNFFIRGDEVMPGEDEVNQEPEEWVMR